MNRLVRIFAIVGLMLATLPLGTVSAQEESDFEINVPEQIVLQATLDLIRGDGQPIRTDIESPFDDVFAGSAGVFAAINESSAAAGQGLGDQLPFADANVWSFVTNHLPTSNDYFVNSPYTVANVIEVTEPVSSCGATEYREVAVFLTRNGMATIGENPNVPNDPGVGASESVSLICTAGLTSTLFILPQGDTVTQFATPYPIFEFELSDRHFVAFITLDPFATYQVVSSFATDTTQQAQFGFVRGDSKTYPAPTDATDGSVLDDDDLSVILTTIAATEATGTPPEAETDPDQTEVPTEDSDTASADAENPDTETPANDAPAGETANQAATQQPTETTSEGGSSAVPAAVAAVVAAAVAGAGVAVTRKRKTSNVVLRGDSKPMLSDAEEIRVAGERAGLATDRGWQQVPYALGREFRDRNGVSKREDVVGDDRSTNVRFQGRPWQWREADDRNLVMDEHFAFWINDENILRVGSLDNPYYFSDLLDSSEYPVDFDYEAYEANEPAAEPFDQKAEGSATTFDENELPPA